MNKKICFQILSEFLEQVEHKYKLQRGSYLISFYVKPNMSICFTIICEDKNRLKTEVDVFLYINNSNGLSCNFKFKINQFLVFYFDDNIDEYNNLKASKQIELLSRALNDVYLRLATIPIQLL